ncbi:MAG: hypothetical protein RSF40_01590 [Oscillospiraceae bacterium]
MNKYFYTFGTDMKFPYQRGWVEVHADNWNEAHVKFRTKFPDRHKNCLNCAFFYDEETFIANTKAHGNFGEFCHEVIE